MPIPDDIYRIVDEQVIAKVTGAELVAAVANSAVAAAIAEQLPDLSDLTNIATLDAAQTFSGAKNFTGGLQVGGTSVVPGDYARKANLDADGAVAKTGAQTIAGAKTFSDAMVVNSSLYVLTTITLASTLNANGNIVLAGNQTIGGTLGVTGNASFSTIQVSGVATFSSAPVIGGVSFNPGNYVAKSGTETITGEKNFTGGLKLGGTLFAPSDYVAKAGTETVTGAKTFSGAATFNGGVTLDGVTLGTATSSGTGGVTSKGITALSFYAGEDAGAGVQSTHYLSCYTAEQDITIDPNIWDKIIGFHAFFVLRPTTSTIATNDVYGANCQVSLAPATTMHFHNVFGGLFIANRQGPGTGGSVVGVQADGRITEGAAHDLVTGINAFARSLHSSAAITDLIGVRAQVVMTAGTVTRATGVMVENNALTGSGTDKVGVRIEEQTVTTPGNWSRCLNFLSEGVTSLNVFEGTVEAGALKQNGQTIDGLSAAGVAMAEAATAGAQRGLTRKAFKVTKSADQTGVNFTAGHNVLFNTDSHDPNGWHDTSSNTERGLPDGDVAAMLLGATIRLANVTANLPVTVSILKNGSTTLAMQTAATASTTPGVSVFAFDPSRISTDYYVVNVYVNDSAADIVADGTNFWGVAL